MVLMPVSLLRCDMLVAKDVETNSSKNAFFPLIRAGSRLTASNIAKLISYNIDAIYIEVEGTDDIVPTEVIDRTLKNEALLHIENLYKTYKKSEQGLTLKMFEDTDQISKKLVENALNNPQVLVSLVSLKRHDDYTYTHSLCVALLSISIGVSLDYNYATLKDLSTAALLHDLGKTTIPNEVLNKPTSLTAAEFRMIKTHPGMGAEMVQKGNVSTPAAILAGIESHHEKYDGSGYPSGLQKDEIHPFAKIIAVADVFDALTSDRSYRKAGQSCEAIEYIMGCANSHFDIEVVRHFLERVVAYPIGSVVLLSNGREAVVVENHSDNIMRPRVRIIGKGNEQNPDLDLLNDLNCYNITIIGVIGA